MGPAHSRRAFLRAATCTLVGAASFEALGTSALAAAATVSELGLVEAQPASPRFVVDPEWPKPLPEGWVTGEVGGTDVDANDHLFIVNRRNLSDKELRVGQPAPTVIEFDPDGNVVNAWQPAVVPANVHGCYVDYQSNVWMAGNEDAIVQKYTHDGSSLLLQIGIKGQFDSSDGTRQGVPLNSSETLLMRPADIAVDPANDEIYIADGYGNHRVIVFDKNGTFLRQWGDAATREEANAGVGGKFLDTVHAVNLGHDGSVYVNDRKGDRIQVFTKQGAFVRNIWVQRGSGDGAGNGSAWDLAFSPDPDQTFIYNTNGENEMLHTLRRDSGEVLGTFGRPGHMAGEFTYMHTLAIDSKSNLYIGETIGGRRVQKLRPVA
jgi:DNA-binding beta-propeller fold protein YncE